MASMESDILDNLKTRLDELAWQNSVEFEKIKLHSTDFRDHELPAIQFYDDAKQVRHDQGRILVNWNIVIEIVMKSTSSDVVDQGVLLDRIEDVERKIGENVQLDLGSATSSQGTMVHVKYLGASTDLGTLDPLFLGILNFQAEYYKPYTGEC